MTTASDRRVTLDRVRTPGAAQEPVFLWGDGYELTARDVVIVLGSYLVTFGDTLGPGGVSPLHAIDAQIRYESDTRVWLRTRTPEEIATIRARAEQIARDFFGHRFPALIW